MSLTKTEFGKTTDGTTIFLYALANRSGMVVRIMTFGALVTELHVPDRSGRAGDVVLGFDNLAQYLAGHRYFGATVGRVANRIARGEFELNGVRYSLARNNGPNHLHGGLKGFDKVVWAAQPQPGPEPAVRFSYLSPDGDDGYPGNLSVSVLFTLTDAQELKIDYTATTDQATPINLTNHSYFNLAGAGQGTVLNHLAQIHADHYTPVDSTLIPTGQIAPVRGTPMDFTTPHPIGQRIAQVPGGYDHNYVLNGPAGQLRPAARIHEPASGRVLEVLTTEPGMQFYTGNFLDGSLAGIGGPFTEHSGFCLETQHFPDSVHHPHFPSVILQPAQTYRQTTVYRFSIA